MKNKMAAVSCGRGVWWGMVASGVSGAWLLLAAAGLVAVCAGPAYYLAGPSGLEGLGYAAFLCLLPGGLALALQGLARTDALRVTLAMAASALRLMLVLAGVLFLRMSRPDLGVKEFFVWLILFYLATLAVETGLLLQSRSRVS